MKLLTQLLRMMISAFIMMAIHILSLPVASHAAQKNILIFHSYCQTNEWTDSIMQGMVETFNDAGMEIDIQVEYLDTSRHTSGAHLDYLEDFYLKKYGDYRIDAVLLSDNPALEFILPLRDMLLPDVPIIFCGINNFQEEQLQGQTGITGINEDIDVRGTVELALQINPGIKEFLVINDRSATGLVNRAKYEQDISGFQSGMPAFELYDNFTPVELKARVSRLSKDSAVLVMRFPLGKGDQPVSHREYLKLVANNCNAPIYTLWSTDIDSEVLGGILVDGRAQGRLAAKNALKILKGEPVSSIPVVMKSPNITMVDYRQLERLDIQKKRIPGDARILFEPESVFDTYRYEIVGSVIVVVILFIVIIILFANIVIRKKTEKALLASEEKLSNALKMAHLGHWEYDNVENVFIFNDYFYAIFHTTAEKAGGYTMPPDEYARRFVHPDDRHLVQEELEKAFETADPNYNRRIEHRMKYADGSTGHMAVRFFISKNIQGQTIRVYGINQDITELRKAEENILRSEVRWRMILQTAMDGFSLVNIAGNIIDVNDAFCRIFGYSREELLTMHISELIHGKTRDDIAAQIKKIIHPGAGRFEAQHVRKDGGIIDAEVSIQYNPMEGGILCAFMRDITERKQVEMRLQQSQKMEAIGTLAGGIAHDFNNILQPMLGYCELLKEDLPPDSPQQDFLDGIRGASLRARELVKQILSFSRQDNEEANPIRLQPVLKEAMKLLRSSIPKTIDIEQDIESDCGIVFADPTQIYQIVMNLCANAYHAMEGSEGELKVALKQIHLNSSDPAFPEMTPGDYALMKVSDTGVGIPPMMINRIFDPYFTTKEKSRGSGLGLSIVQGIVKRYNGDIRIYSEPGKGTEIHIYFPIIEKNAAMESSAGRESLQRGTEKILLIDDEKPVAEMIFQMLKRLGYQVTTRLNGIEALQLLKSTPGDFDLVITDLTMPNMTGIQLAREIKKMERDIPIILCTGFSEQTSDDKLKSYGIHAKIAKPVILKDLSETIRTVLSGTKVA